MILSEAILAAHFDRILQWNTSGSLQNAIQ